MENKTNIYKKVFDLKSHIGKISKDSTNPFHNSKYFDINKLLEVVEPLLQEREILLIQPIIDSKVYTKLIDLISGEELESFIELSPNQDPQKVGICITYFRRYTLKSMLGIQEEDDDGNGAIKRDEKKPKVESKKYTLTTTDVEKWNGKIYSGKYVYVNNEKIEPPIEQLEKLKLHKNYKPDNK